MVSDDVRTLVGRKHTIEILNLLIKYNRIRYSEIENRVDTSSDMVSESLELLCEQGLAERIEESPKNVSYTDTERGREFIDAVEAVEATLNAETES